MPYLEGSVAFDLNPAHGHSVEQGFHKYQASLIKSIYELVQKQMALSFEEMSQQIQSIFFKSQNQFFLDEKRLEELRAFLSQKLSEQQVALILDQLIEQTEKKLKKLVQWVKKYLPASVYQIKSSGHHLIFKVREGQSELSVQLEKNLLKKSQEKQKLKDYHQKLWAHLSQSLEFVKKFQNQIDQVYLFLKKLNLPYEEMQLIQSFLKNIEQQLEPVRQDLNDLSVQNYAEYLPQMTESLLISNLLKIQELKAQLNKIEQAVPSSNPSENPFKKISVKDQQTIALLQNTEIDMVTESSSEIDQAAMQLLKDLDIQQVEAAVVLEKDEHKKKLLKNLISQVKASNETDLKNS